MRTCISLLLIFIAAGCTPDHEPDDHPYQAISALGDTLYAPPLDPETEQRYTLNLERARAEYEADPDDAENIIWYGRRTAYTGSYRKAIDIFSGGIEKHPDDPRMYRHRGHRYITIRQFERAISDLEKAADLIRGTEDRVEPDGIPNAENKPRSTLHTNIWYHLGLAHYYSGHFDQASEAFQHCREASPNDDMLVASLYWLYMSLRRAGKDMQAGTVLQPVKTEMDIIENTDYHNLLLVFKGVFDADHLLEQTDALLASSTVGYGIGNWHYINGRTERARNLFTDVYEKGYWPAFGYIGAETDLERIDWEDF